MSTKNISSALKETLINSGIGIDIVMPNTSYAEVVGTPYCRVFFIPSEPNAAELGTRKTENVLGIFQIDLYYPVEQGDGELMDAVDLLKRTYGKGDNITYGESCVRVQSAYPSTAPETIDGAWFKQTFDVTWSAYEFLS